MWVAPSSVTASRVKCVCGSLQRDGVQGLSMCVAPSSVTAFPTHGSEHASDSTAVITRLSHHIANYETATMAALDRDTGGTLARH